MDVEVEIHDWALGRAPGPAESRGGESVWGLWQFPRVMAGWSSGKLTKSGIVTGDPSGVGAGPTRGGQPETTMSVWSHKGWDHTVFLFMGIPYRTRSPALTLDEWTGQVWSGLQCWALPPWDFFPFWGRAWVGGERQCWGLTGRIGRGGKREQGDMLKEMTIFNENKIK